MKDCAIGSVEQQPLETREDLTPRRLRVVFVDHVARLSGGEIALLRLLPALSRKVDVHVILGEDGPLVKRLQAFGIDVEVMPLSPRLRDIRKASVRPSAIDVRAVADLPKYVFRLRRRLRELDADIVHTNSLKAALYGGVAGRLTRIPVVWHIRDRIAPDYLPRPAIALVHIAARLLPTAVVANSRATLATVPRPRRQQVLHNPVVPDSVERRRQSRAERDSDEIVVGIIGRLAPWKGQHVFLDGFAEAFGGTHVRGRIVGTAMFGEDDYADSLQRRAERLGISDRIEFCGFREDVWAELRRLDILVHCSVTPEPFGQVVLEGMAARVPVIATNGGGPAELITNGVDGILTTPGDTAELASALRRLRDDRELRAALVQGGLKRSAAFTPEQATDQLLEIYRGIVAPRRLRMPVGLQGAQPDVMGPDTLA